MPKQDWCTLSPDGCWGDPCCKRHDKRYENKRLTRKQADELLRRCILRKSGDGLIANIYYYGVRMFGWYFYWKANNKKKK